jgi:hypothetical protein
MSEYTKAIIGEVARGLLQRPESKVDVLSVSETYEAHGDAGYFTFTLGGGQRFLCYLRPIVSNEVGKNERIKLEAPKTEVA